MNLKLPYTSTELVGQFLVLMALLISAACADSAKVISAGYNHTCLVQEDWWTKERWVKCWGHNAEGELGNGTMTPTFTWSLLKGQYADLSHGGLGSFICAILNDATVMCWGENVSGQLGDGTYNNSAIPVVVKGVGMAKAVATGSSHACAVIADGTVMCWGANSSGQLGNGTSSNSSAPASVTGIGNAIGVAAGQSHSCAVLQDSSVRCWGSNLGRQLGPSTTADLSNVPVSIPGLTTVRSITSGDFFNCALLADATVRCWGNLDDGRLGNGMSGPGGSPTPSVVAGVSNAIAVQSGFGHTCAVISGGQIKCWGANESGQLGIGTMGTGSPNPVTVTGVGNARAVTAGFSHSCVIVSDDAAPILCWGKNVQGQLGNGNNAGSPLPVKAGLFPQN